MNSSKEETKADICSANANCGIAEVNEVKMEEEKCTCKLLRSCSDKSREEHLEQHEEECLKQAAKMQDDDLFRQPERSHLGECPICFLPMPFDPKKSMTMGCCSKPICMGCVCSNIIINNHDLVKANSCLFCREPMVDDGEYEKRVMKRIKANDPAALRQLGTKRYNEEDYDTAIEYWTKAAQLGDAHAHYQLGCMYRDGKGVAKNEEKAVYHWEMAAIGGHHMARHNLGCIEGIKGNMVRAVKHFIIAANLGYEESMKKLWAHYSGGNITKEDLDATLRTHHAAVNEMKSPERDEADNCWKIGLRFPSSSEQVLILVPKI
jgi:tetratricopeptide (TPR) repeat protein